MLVSLLLQANGLATPDPAVPEVVVELVIVAVVVAGVVVVATRVGFVTWYVLVVVVAVHGSLAERAHNGAPNSTDDRARGAARYRAHRAAGHGARRG